MEGGPGAGAGRGGAVSPTHCRRRPMPLPHAPSRGQAAACVQLPATRPAPSSRPSAGLRMTPSWQCCKRYWTRAAMPGPAIGRRRTRGGGRRRVCSGPQPQQTGVAVPGPGPGPGHQPTPHTRTFRVDWGALAGVMGGGVVDGGSWRTGRRVVPQALRFRRGATQRWARPSGATPAQQRRAGTGGAEQAPQALRSRG
jgi:hypothetical protein